MGTGSSRDLTDEQNERLREILRPLVGRSGDLPYTQTSLGKAIGLSQAHVSGFLSGTRGLSIVAALRALDLVGVDPRTVLGDSLPLASSSTDRYPHRAAAIERMAGLWSHRTVQLLRSMVLLRATDPTEREWIEQGNAIESDNPLPIRTVDPGD